MDESTIDYLKRRLRQAGAESWHGIAQECKVAKSLPRKIAYGDRPNPGVQTIQPLLDYFRALDRAAAAPAQGGEEIAQGNGRPAQSLPGGIERRDPNRANPFPDLDRRASAGDA